MPPFRFSSLRSWISFVNLAVLSFQVLLHLTLREHSFILFSFLPEYRRFSLLRFFYCFDSYKVLQNVPNFYCEF